ncbi:GIP, partial [Symbiodinium pilosum]
AFVTLSTAESELVAGLDAVVALQSAEAMLSDFGITGLDKTLRVDSQSALAIAVGQGAASQGDEELEDISIPVSLNTD